MKITIISGSVRNGRDSHRVALFFKNFILENQLAEAEILDLKEYNFPIFEERLQYMKEAPDNARAFSEKIKDADGIIMVTPEYNGGYPAALKNVIDLLYPEWKKKPVAIATVSDGQFAGTQVITSLVFSLWKIGAWVVPAMFPTPKVAENYDEQGRPAQKEASEKKARHFVGELMWAIEAGMKMQS